MSQLSNPYMFKAVIRYEQVLEDGDDISSIATARVLCSQSGARFELGEIIKKTIYGAVLHGVVLEPLAASSSVFVRSEEDVAIKVYAKHLVTQNLARSREQPLNEMAILQYVGNNFPHILGQIECCADDNNMYSIMPWVHGGELFDHVADNGPMSEEEAKAMFYRLILALKRLHELQIAHRDISLENIMFNQEDRDTKLIDFGMAIPLFHRHHDHRTRGIFDTKNDMCGKMNYMPPEVVRGDTHVDPFAGDVWSAGVVLFYSLLGFPPMERASPDDQRYALIMGGELRKLLQHWQVNLSDQALSLIVMMLTEDVHSRPTLEAILRHPWLEEEHKKYLHQNPHQVQMVHSTNDSEETEAVAPHRLVSMNPSANSNAMKMQLRSLSRREAANLHCAGNTMHACG